ncbi:MAG: PEP-CTERM sorting domain-containing protein [Phycisphaerae bacterium]
MTSQDTNGFSWFTFDQPNGLLGFSLATSVPEPESLALIAVGLIGVFSFKKRRYSI